MLVRDVKQGGGLVFEFGGSRVIVGVAWARSGRAHLVIELPDSMRVHQVPVYSVDDFGELLPPKNHRTAPSRSTAGGSDKESH